MWGRFIDRIRALPWYWRVVWAVCLVPIVVALLVMSMPASPTMQAIESVGGEVFDPFAPTTSAAAFESVVRFLMRNPTPKDLYLGPRDQSRMLTRQVYNERLTDEAILQMDLSELGHLRVVDMSGPHVTDRGFTHVAGNSLVSNLDCRNAMVTDAGLAALEKNTRLISLDLTGNKITDAGIGLIVRSPSLGSLGLNDTCITDQAIQVLASSRHKIVSLRVASTDVTAGGLAGLSQIQGFRAIGLDVHQFSDEAVTILQPLSLNSLVVHTCSDRKKNQLLQAGATSPMQIDDQVLSKVSKLQTLEYVTLCGLAPDEPAKLTPSVIGSLKSMPNLKYLYILDLSVDRNFLDSLQQAIPTLRIWMGGKPLNPW